MAQHLLARTDLVATVAYPLRRMYGEDAENVMYYMTVYNEPYQQPAEPEDLDVEGGHDLAIINISLHEARDIEGVRAEGTRTTMTIPAGQIGNELPINIVSERWFSPDLKVLVMSRQSDPRFGETTYRLTNLSRAEPPFAADGSGMPIDVEGSSFLALVMRGGTKQTDAGTSSYDASVFRNSGRITSTVAPMTGSPSASVTTPDKVPISFESLSDSSTASSFDSISFTAEPTRGAASRTW